MRHVWVKHTWLLHAGKEGQHRGEENPQLHYDIITFPLTTCRKCALLDQSRRKNTQVLKYLLMSSLIKGYSSFLNMHHISKPEHITYHTYISFAECASSCCRSRSFAYQDHFSFAAPAPV